MSNYGDEKSVKELFFFFDVILILKNYIKLSKVHEGVKEEKKRKKSQITSLLWF